MKETLGDQGKDKRRRHVHIMATVVLCALLLSGAAMSTQAQVVQVHENHVDVNFGDDNLNFTVRAAASILNVWVKVCIYGEVRSDLFKITDIFSGGSTNVFDYTDTEVITDVWVKTGTTDDGGPGVHFPNGNAACPPPPGEEPDPECDGPKEVTAEAVGHSVWVNWTAVEDADSYRIYRAEGDGGFRFLAEEPGGATAHHDGTVAGETDYRYTVSAVIDDEETDTCVTAEVTSHDTSHEDPCDGPAHISAEQTDDGIVLQWEALDNATSYNVYRAVGNETDFTLIASTNSTNHTDSDIVMNETYRYQVTAIVDGNETESCSTIEVKTQENERPDDGACEGPESVQAMSSGEDIWVTWSAVDNATMYKVYRAVGGGDFAPLADVDGNNTEYRDDAVDPGTTYGYQVTAVVDGNETEACTTAEATAIPDFPTLTAGLLASVVALGAYVRARRRS